MFVFETEKSANNRAWAKSIEISLQDMKTRITSPKPRLKTRNCKWRTADLSIIKNKTLFEILCLYQIENLLQGI